MLPFLSIEAFSRTHFPCQDIYPCRRWEDDQMISMSPTGKREELVCWSFVPFLPLFSSTYKSCPVLCSEHIFLSLIEYSYYSCFKVLLILTSGSDVDQYWWLFPWEQLFSWSHIVLSVDGVLWKLWVPLYFSEECWRVCWAHSQLD